VWVGTSGRGLNRIKSAEIVHYTKSSGLPGDTILVLREGRGGKLWVGTSAGLAYFEAGRFIRVDAGGKSSYNAITAMAAAPDGTLWVADAQQGLQHLSGKGVLIRDHSFTPAKDIIELYCDRASRLWVGLFSGGVTVWDGKSAVSYGSRDGLL